MTKTKRVLSLFAAAALVMGGATACATDNFRDLEGVNSTDPDYVRLVNSPDGHPNIVLYCADGVAYSTTTRDYNAFNFVTDPQFVAFCKTVGHPGSKDSRTNK